jgi:hypothetical protein
MASAWVIEVRLANQQDVYWAGGERRRSYIPSIEGARTYPSLAAAYERALWLLDTRRGEVEKAEVKPAA